MKKTEAIPGVESDLSQVLGLGVKQNAGMEITQGSGLSLGVISKWAESIT